MGKPPFKLNLWRHSTAGSSAFTYTNVQEDIIKHFSQNVCAYVLSLAADALLKFYTVSIKQYK